MSPLFPYDLIQRYNRGDHSAYETIFNEFYPGIFTYVKGFIKNREDAEDMVSAIFAKLFTQKAQFADLPRLKSYLFLTARSACLDKLKHIQLQQVKEREIADHWFTEAENPMERIERLEIRESIQKAIDGLPAKCRQVFVLHFVEGLDDPEIAARMNISRKTVSNQKSRALKMLRITLQGMNDFLLLCILGSLDYTFTSCWS